MSTVSDWGIKVQSECKQYDDYSAFRITVDGRRILNLTNSHHTALIKINEKFGNWRKNN